MFKFNCSTKICAILSSKGLTIKLIAYIVKSSCFSFSNQLIINHKLDNSAMVFHIITIQVKTNNPCSKTSGFHIRTFTLITNIFCNCFFAYTHGEFLVIKEMHPFATFMLFKQFCFVSKIPTPTSKLFHLHPPFTLHNF